VEDNRLEEGSHPVEGNHQEVDNHPADTVLEEHLDIQGSGEDNLQDNQTAGTVPVDIDQADIGQVADDVRSDTAPEDGFQLDNVQVDNTACRVLLPFSFFSVPSSRLSLHHHQSQN
jgi:hypothetical protein